MSFNRIYFAGSIAVAALVCIAQISGGTMFILLSLAMFMGLAAVSSAKNFTLPVMLFFLPWAPILKINPGSFSFYTIAMVMICLISAVKNHQTFKRYHITAGILLVLITLISKLIDASKLALDYVCFMMLIVLMPVMQKEALVKKYSIYDVVVYLAAGAVIAGLCAQRFAGYGNIARYIRVDAYLTIVRRCGFNPDPNFYMAQITAAIGGCLVLILRRDNRKRALFLSILLMLLLYCGFMSGSKTFAVVVAAEILLWVIELFRLRNQPGFKFTLILCGIIAVIYIATSTVFGGLIDTLITRFSFTTDISSLTTHRTDLWVNYYDAILDDLKVLLIGEGYTDVTVLGRASHNTVIQTIYQFGILGSAVLLGWIYCFYHYDSLEKSGKKNLVRIGIMLAGVYLPWLAIDMLFFDEFFLLQWFCLIAIRQLGYKEEAAEMAAAAETEMLNEAIERD